MPFQTTVLGVGIDSITDLIENLHCNIRMILHICLSEIIMGIGINQVEKIWRMTNMHTSIAWFYIVQIMIFFCVFGLRTNPPIKIEKSKNHPQLNSQIHHNQIPTQSSS